MPSSVCSTMSRMAAAAEIELKNCNSKDCLFDFIEFPRVVIAISNLIYSILLIQCAESS